MNLKTEDSRKWRAEQRRLGFTPKLCWVQPSDWPRVQKLVQMLAKRAKRKLPTDKENGR